MMQLPRSTVLASLAVALTSYRLHDPVFSYVDGYRVKLRTTGTVPVSTTPVTFVAVAVPSGGLTTPFEKRAALAWRHAT